jgi:DNA repair exonuclease SbcCD ATPase subunit
MPRKTQSNRIESKLMQKITDKLVAISPLEAAKASLPFFGGEDETESTVEADESNGTESATSTAGTDANGSSSSSEELTKNPEAMADLLKQLNDATKTIKDLQNKTASYEKEKTNAARAQQTREEQLEADLTDAQQTIAKMDSVIRHTAMVNAIQGMKDFEFHSARHVLNELDSNAFDIDVDLENGTAIVTNIEAEIKRVAKEMPWLVAQNKASGNVGVSGKTTMRSSGAPPANPNGDAAKVARREALMKKFPVISHGRAVR